MEIRLYIQMQLNVVVEIAGPPLTTTSLLQCPERIQIPVISLVLQTSLQSDHPVIMTVFSRPKGGHIYGVPLKSFM